MTRLLSVARLRSVAVLFAIAACSDAPTAARPSCGADGVDLTQLQVFEGATVRGAGLECIRLSGGANYVLAPQILGETLPYVYQPFQIGEPDAQVEVAFGTSSLSATPTERTQERLHNFVRGREAALRPRRIPRPLNMTATDDQSHREFSVLAALSEPIRFTRVQATRRYDGSKVALYVDDRVPTAYSDAELTAMGTQFNDVLYDVASRAFGDASDIDGNGRVMVLLTPAVNALVAAADCASFGFATGYFYGFDLSDTSAESNQGEVFYALTPDPTGAYSCPHTKADVSTLLPATFIHELQHMISYGHRVVTLHGAPEVPWLNEGLSHVAEELGSLDYEQRYPPPSGRTSPEQLFPDSAAGLVIGDLFNSYRFLAFSPQYSITNCAPNTFCSTPERGAAWLFLRWLDDVTGDSALYGKLVRSAAQGRENVAAVTGRSIDDLIGEFTLALWADSIVGAPRSSAPAHLRFGSRNLRRVYRALYDAVGPLGGIPQPFPIAPVTLEPGTRRQSAIRPGSFQFFQLAAPSTRAEIAIGFTAGDGIALRDMQRAQLSILRVP